MSADPTKLPDLKLASAAQSGAGQSSRQDIRKEAAGNINSGIAPGANVWILAGALALLAYVVYKRVG